jgi:hypothetical protein
VPAGYTRRLVQSGQAEGALDFGKLPQHERPTLSPLNLREFRLDPVLNGLQSLEERLIERPIPWLQLNARSHRFRDSGSAPSLALGGCHSLVADRSAGHRFKPPFS